MAVIDFKSVGELTSNIEERILENDVESTPVGIKTPLRPGLDSDGLFSMHYNLGNQLRDNLRNLILTNHGERLGFYDLGGNLLPLTMELSSLSKDDFDNEVVLRISRTVARFMPFISLNTFESSIERDNNDHVGKVRMHITYDIPDADLTNQELEITMFAGG